MMLGYAYRALTAVFTAIYLLVSVIACSAEAPEPAEPVDRDAILGVSSRQPVMEVLQVRPEIGQALQQAADVYRARKQEPLPISIQTVPEADYRSTLRARMISGEAPSLFHLQEPRDFAAFSEYLAPLDAMGWAGDALGGVSSWAVGDGGLYGIPYSLEGIGLLVNRDIFAAAEVDIGGIYDFEGLSEAFQALQEQIATGVALERYPALEAVTDVAGMDGDYLLATAGSALLDGTFASPPEALGAPSIAPVNGEDVGSLLTLLLQHSPHRGNWPAACETDDIRLVEGGLASGRIAAIFHSTGVSRRILAANPDFSDRLLLLPVVLENQEQGTVYLDVPTWWAVSGQGDAAVRAQSMDFLTWLYRSKEGIALYNDQFGALSPYRDGAKNSLDSLALQLLDYIERGVVSPALYRGAPAGYEAEVFTPEVQGYFLEYNKPWSEVLQSCVDGWLALQLGETPAHAESSSAISDVP